MSWFSFIATPYKHCGLSCCNPNGANGINKKPVLKRSQTKSYSRHSMILNSPTNGPNTPGIQLEKFNDSFDGGVLADGNATMRAGFSSSFKF